MIKIITNDNKCLQTKVSISLPNNILMAFYVCIVESRRFDSINCLTVPEINSGYKKSEL